MKNFIFHLKARFKLLLKGKFWAFWNYGKLGFTSLTYRGKPVILREDVPKNTIYMINIPEDEIVENFLDWGKIVKENPRRFGKSLKISSQKN